MRPIPFLPARVRPYFGDTGFLTLTSLARRGYEDLNDAVRVSADPTFRLIDSKKNWDRGTALTSRLQSFETGMPLAMRT